jgi:hypothetical protein
VRALKELLAEVRPAPGPAGEVAPEDVERIRSALTRAARRAQEAVRSEADRRKRPARDFHATLLLAAHAPFGDRDMAASLRVGDGAVALYAAPGVCNSLGAGDHGNFASETRFLTTPGIEDGFERRVSLAVVRNLRALAVMTDGVADDFFPEAQRLIDLFDGRPARDLKSADGGPVLGLLHEVTREPRDGQALLDWLRYEKKGSSDDRTLVLLYRTQEEASGGR